MKKLLAIYCVLLALLAMQSAGQANNTQILTDSSLSGIGGIEINATGSGQIYTLSELNGKLANQQDDYMDKNWEAVDAKTAQERANNGDLVVAGLSDNPHGHTSIVVPGDGAVKPDGRFYPNVEGGAMNKWARDHGTGDYTAGDVWSTTDRKNVKYYVPK